MGVTGGQYDVRPIRPTGSVWFHVVVNFIGPNGGEGIRVYHDGTEAARDYFRHFFSLYSPSGRIAVGKRIISSRYDHVTGIFGSVQMDELCCTITL